MQKFLAYHCGSGEVKGAVDVHDHHADDEGVDEVGAVGDSAERVEAGRREQAADRASVAGAARHNHPGGAERPRCVAQRRVSGRCVRVQLSVVQTVQQTQHHGRAHRPPN